MHPATPATKTTPSPSDGAGAGSAGAPPARLGPVAFGAVIVANVSLAFGPYFVRLADTEGGVGPVAAAFWRTALAVPLIAGLSVAAGARPQRLPAGLWAALIAAGVCFAADLGSWHLGILRTSLANATLFGNAATFIFPLYGFLVARAWPTRTQGFALALAAGGAALLMGRSYQLDAKNLAGDLLCLLAGLLYTAYFILMARVREAMAPLSALAVSTAACVVPLWLFAHTLGETILPRDWTALWALALVSQVLGQGCMIYALGRVSPLVVGLALLLQPVVAGTVGWIAYRETLGVADLIGVVMVAAALVLVRSGGTVARDETAPHKDGHDR